MTITDEEYIKQMNEPIENYRLRKDIERTVQERDAEKCCPFQYCQDVPLTIKFIADFCKGDYTNCPHYEIKKGDLKDEL